MKKIISLLMCLTVLFCVHASLAEDKEVLGSIDMNGAFELRCTVPEGYTVTKIETGLDTGSFLALIQSEDPAKPVMQLSIAFDELLSEVDRLNDLDEDALQKIEQTFREEDQVEISYHETAYGTKLMTIKETRDDVDFVDFYTIYKGYQLEFVLVRGMEAAETLTDEQIQSAVDFLSELDFVEIQSAE